MSFSFSKIATCYWNVYIDLWKSTFKNDIFGVNEFFPWIFISKMGVKMKSITKNHVADPELGLLTKSTLNDRYNTTRSKSR